MPIALVGLGTLAAGSGLGAINGALVARLGLPSIVVTLATLVIGRESLRYMREGEFVRNLPPGFQWFGAGQAAGQWLVVAIALLVFAAFAWGSASPGSGQGGLRHGFGPRGRAAGGHPASSRGFRRLCRHGRAGGAGGSAQRGPLFRRRPQRRTGLELQVIAAVVVGGVAVSGGRGTLAGSLIGVALLGSIGPALVFLGANLPAGLEWFGKPQWEKAIQGLIILLAVASDAFYREGR